MVNFKYPVRTVSVLEIKPVEDKTCCRREFRVVQLFQLKVHDMNSCITTRFGFEVAPNPWSRQLGPNNARCLTCLLGVRTVPPHQIGHSS
jgi:hypothetical protein